MDDQKITKAKGRPMLQWSGKKPLDRVEYFPAQEKEIYGDKTSKEFNKLFWGDNLQVLSHLLKDYRGKIDLIYIDPPFDSKADYVKRVKIRGEKLEGNQQSILEEKQYTDIWENDEYLQFMYERLIVMRELLSEKGSIYLHCDWHKNSYLRLIMDEVFGSSNFQNEIVVHYTAVGLKAKSQKFHQNTESVFYYIKNKTTPATHIYHEVFEKLDKARRASKHEWNEELGKAERVRNTNGQIEYFDVWENKADNFIEVSAIRGDNKTDYPTQKEEAILERVIRASSNSDSVVLDCFCGSGTTMAVAQKLGRRWIGCDINIGAVQTATKRLAQIIDGQVKGNDNKLIEDSFKGLSAFKVLNVNDYDIFKNEIEAKEIVMDTYGIEPVKRTWFDGELDNNLVKIMPLNRVLNKLDIKEAIKNVSDNLDSFTPKTTTGAGEEIYKEGVILVCSGAEIDAEDYIRKENNTGVSIAIRNILNDKKNLIFKKKPEAKVETHVSNNDLTITIKEFYSPILMRKLELENEKLIDKSNEAKVGDFKQIVDSVAIDIDYDGKLFNAEIMDLPDKKAIITGEYKYNYTKKGDYTVAIKIIDVLGEEYFETFEIKI